MEKIWQIWGMICCRNKFLWTASRCRISLFQRKSPACRAFLVQVVMASDIWNRPNCDLLEKWDFWPSVRVSHLRHCPYCPLCCHRELWVEAKEDGRTHGDPVHDGHRGDPLGQLLQKMLGPEIITFCIDIYRWITTCRSWSDKFCLQRQSSPLSSSSQWSATPLNRIPIEWELCGYTYTPNNPQAL